MTSFVATWGVLLSDDNLSYVIIRDLHLFDQPLPDEFLLVDHFSPHHGDFLIGRFSVFDNVKAVN